MTGDSPRVRIVGRGRAGESLARALGRVGWDVVASPSRRDPLDRAAEDVDVVVLAVPDDQIRAVAGSIDPGPATVCHLAGSLGLDVLDPHRSRAALHPLVSLPNPDIGAQRLVGAWFAVAGEEIARSMAQALGGRSFEIADADRARYHAAAAIASNHLVALMGQVERLGASVGVPSGALADLARETLENVADLGAGAALTGPIARGDEATVERHRAALPDDERPLYDALAGAARRLASERDVES